MAGKFEVYKDKAGEFRFRLKAGNGQNILGSEGYSKKASCMNGIESVKKNAASAEVVETERTRAAGHREALASGGDFKLAYEKYQQAAGMGATGS